MGWGGGGRLLIVNSIFFCSFVFRCRICDTVTLEGPYVKYVPPDRLGTSGKAKSSPGACVFSTLFLVLEAAHTQDLGQN
jgi:hypothetical protein